MTEALAPREKSKKQRDNTNTPPKLRLHNDLSFLGRSVGVTTASQLVWLNRLTGSQPAHSLQQLCNRGHGHAGILQPTEPGETQSLRLSLSLILRLLLSQLAYMYSSRLSLEKVYLCFTY